MYKIATKLSLMQSIQISFKMKQIIYAPYWKLVQLFPRTMIVNHIQVFNYFSSFSLPEGKFAKLLFRQKCKTWCNKVKN